MDDTAITAELERIRDALLDTQRSMERIQEEAGGFRDELEEIRGTLGSVIEKLGEMASNP